MRSHETSRASRALAYIDAARSSTDLTDTQLSWQSCRQEGSMGSTRRRGARNSKLETLRLRNQPGITPVQVMQELGISILRSRPVLTVAFGGLAEE